MPLCRRYQTCMDCLFIIIKLPFANRRAPIHFLIVFLFQTTTAGFRSPSKFKVRFMSAQYVKLSLLCVKLSLLTMSAQYAKSLPDAPDVLCYDIFANHIPACLSCLIIHFCYKIPYDFFFALLKLYILLWFLRILPILTFL